MIMSAVVGGRSPMCVSHIRRRCRVGSLETSVITHAYGLASRLELATPSTTQITVRCCLKYLESG